MTAQRRGAASDSSSLHAPVRSEARVYHTRGRLCSTVGCRDRQGGHASGSEPFTARSFLSRQAGDRFASTRPCTEGGHLLALGISSLFDLGASESFCSFDLDLVLECSIQLGQSLERPLGIRDQLHGFFVPGF